MSIRPFIVLLHVSSGASAPAPLLHSVLASSSDEALGNAVNAVLRAGQGAAITHASAIDAEDCTRKLYEQREMQQVNAGRAMRDAEAEAVRMGVHPAQQGMVRVPEGHATIDPSDPHLRDFARAAREAYSHEAAEAAGGAMAYDNDPARATQ